MVDLCCVRIEWACDEPPTWHCLGRCNSCGCNPPHAPTPSILEAWHIQQEPGPSIETEGPRLLPLVYDPLIISPLDTFLHLCSVLLFCLALLRSYLFHFPPFNCNPPSFGLMLASSCFYVITSCYLSTQQGPNNTYFYIIFVVISVSGFCSLHHSCCSVNCNAFFYIQWYL